MKSGNSSTDKAIHYFTGHLPCFTDILNRLTPTERKANNLSPALIKTLDGRQSFVLCTRDAQRRDADIVK